jgi:hypothetical protein
MRIDRCEQARHAISDGVVHAGDVPCANVQVELGCARVERTQECKESG